MDRPAKRVKIAHSPALPAPAAVIVATFLDPNELLAAARVSRAWHSLFTSDAAWAHYNVYDVGDVCSQYLSTKPSCEQEAWAFPSTCAPKDTSNLYHILAMMRGTREWYPPAQRDAPKSFYTALVRAPCKSCPAFTWVERDIQDDKDLVYALLRAGFSAYGLDERYRTDRTAALSIQQQSASDFNFDPAQPTFSPEIFNDYEVAKHAVKLWPAAYDHFPDHFREDPDLFIEQVSRWINRFYEAERPFSTAPLSIRSSRKVALIVTARSSRYLSHLSQDLQEDWDLVWRSLSSDLLYEIFYDIPPISPKFLASKDKVLQILETRHVLPLSNLPRELLLDVDVLEKYISRARKWNEQNLYTRCPLVKRLCAVMPVNIHRDFQFIKRVLTKEISPMEKFKPLAALKRELNAEFR